ncbi:MAG: hypothetical protein IKB08_03555 [Clostridia bacterium]|nr:hypothetical protein [Clostridia bacterium]
MKRIEEIDKNFKASAPVFDGMRTYDILKSPFSLYGLKSDSDGFFRMDKNVADTVSEGVSGLNYNTSGGCLRFRTDSRDITLTAHLPDVCLMNHMPLTGSSSFDIYCNGSFCGVFRAPSAEKYKGVWSSSLRLPEGMKDVMIFFPLYNNVKEVFVSLEEKAAVLEGDSFCESKPIVFYGSSITQGGCASRPGNAYPNLISRKLNREILNLGFSGSCKAEYEMCEYIACLPMSLLVLDYDHNAPTPEFLEATHERFFRQFRNKCPDTPVVMISVADCCFGEEDARRRKEIIKRTYENAKANGDRNVYFLDGQRFYDETGLDNSTVDTCHPNDLGFFAFYKNISKFIKENDL